MIHNKKYSKPKAYRTTFTRESYESDTRTLQSLCSEDEPKIRRAARMKGRLVLY